MKLIKAVIVVSLICISSDNSFAQLATGTQKFGSFGGGEFDTINLGNLNVVFSVPILHKAGRGLPFNYDLTYNSSIYQVVTSNGNKSWQPASSAGNAGMYWGWQGLGPVFSPYISHCVTQ